MGHHLIIIDPNIPKHYLTTMKKVAENHPDVQFVHSDNYLHPNDSKNIGMQYINDAKYIISLENDVMVNNNWLELMLDACEAENAGVVRPLIMERLLGRLVPHFDSRIGHITQLEQKGTIYHRITATHSAKLDLYSSRRIVQTVEAHCLLFKREILDKIIPFETGIPGREYIDLSLRLFAEKAKIVFEPKAVVTLYGVPPLQKDELNFYNFLWDKEQGKKTEIKLIEKWNLLNLPSSLDFIENRQYFVSYSKLLEYILRKYIPKRLKHLAKQEKNKRKSELEKRTLHN
jgi:hypothetical protein